MSADQDEDGQQAAHQRCAPSRAPCHAPLAPADQPAGDRQQPQGGASGGHNHAGKKIAIVAFQPPRQVDADQEPQQQVEGEHRQLVAAEADAPPEPQPQDDQESIGIGEGVDEAPGDFHGHNANGAENRAGLVGRSRRRRRPLHLGRKERRRRGHRTLEHFHVAPAKQHPVWFAAEQRHVHQQDPGRQHGRAQQSPDDQPPPLAGHGGPAHEPPQSQRRRQQPAFGPRVDGQRPGDARAEKQPGLQLHHRPPTQVKRQDQQEPERGIANDQRAMQHQLGMKGVEQAADRGHLRVELPPQPAKQRQHRQAGQGNAPALAGPKPVQPRAVQRHQDQRIDVQTQQFHQWPVIAFVQGLADAEIIDRVRPDDVPAGSRPQLHGQAEEHQAGQDRAAQRGNGAGPGGSKR